MADGEDGGGGPNQPPLNRVDNEWNRDRNVWLLSSLQRQRSFAGVRFCIRLSVGYPFLVDGVLMAMFRRVIRLAPDPDAYDPIRTVSSHDL